MVTRRVFLEKTATLAAAGMIAPNIQGARAFGSNSANDKINVALIGCRNMGWTNLTEFLRFKNINCVALCDINQNLLKNRHKELTEQFGQEAKMYSDYRRILDRKDVDVVIISTPDHWHCLQFVDSCSAGKSIYVEKPLANSIAECDAMVYAANRHDNIVQVGQQQRSGVHWQKMTKYIKEGNLGKVGQVNIWANFNYAALLTPVADTETPQGVDFDKWLGPALRVNFNPSKLNGLWRLYWAYGGGLLTDWGVHLIDMALLGMGINQMPNKVMAIGNNHLYPEGGHETFDTLNVLYEFDNFTVTWNNSAGIGRNYGGRAYGVMFKGTKGTIIADRENWELLEEDDRGLRHLKVNKENDDHFNHVKNFIECVNMGNCSTECPVEVGSLCAKYAHIGNISARMGGEVLVYNDTEMSFNNPQANEFIKPKYHNSYKIPIIK